MANILLIYSTTDGHTREICQALRRVMSQENNQVTLTPIEDVSRLDIGSFDKIVVGASIRYGKHSRKVYDFVRINEKILDGKPNAFFSVNVVARKPEKRRPDTNPYLKKFLKEISWRPKVLAVFAGKIDYPRYRFWDRQMIRFIMWMTNGPTDPEAVVEFTDWNEVEAFGQLVCKM